MRLFILIILLAALILPGAALAAPAAQTPQTAIVITDTLNVRAGPGATSIRVGQAKRGDALSVIDRNTDATWLWVRLPNGQEGWVSAALVRLSNKPAAPSVPVSKTGVPVGAVQVQFVDVVDGDTIRVSVGGVTENLRYIGIDTPERGQPGYDAATTANRALLTPALYVVSDRSDCDLYDRLLRYVYTDAGVMVNAEMDVGESGEAKRRSDCDPRAGRCAFIRSARTGGDSAHRPSSCAGTRGTGTECERFRGDFDRFL